MAVAGSSSGQPIDYNIDGGEGRGERGEKEIIFIRLSFGPPTIARINPLAKAAAIFSCFSSASGRSSRKAIINRVPAVKSGSLSAALWAVSQWTSCPQREQKTCRILANSKRK